MIDDVQDRQPSARRTGRRISIYLAALGLVLVTVLVAPPMVSISRYKSRITQLISTSLGRPVRLSSVKLHLLPWPGFVLTDLSVAEDPAYGAEPVLHAASVTASIRLLSLWRGRLEIGSISVDEASLNLVRNGPGRWNLDPLFRTAAAQAGSAGGIQRRIVPLPSLEATNSRINIKNGAEKLPFSLVNTDLDFWQDNPGEWHIRLRGQPARTDVSLYQEDTGVVRLEATVRRAPSLREMPVHLDLDWRQAQLGQLARLVTGSDPGWRGDLTGELHLDGTADAAHITSRLRATGVHRAEFAPAEPMDFDANCSFVYHYARRALENVECNSPLGDGRVRLTGDLPNQAGYRQLTLELDRIPIAAGLDALRTVRSDIPADLDAIGTVSGKVSYAPQAADAEPAKPVKLARRRSPKAALAAAGPLTGALDVQGLELRGAGLNRPIQFPRFALEPATGDSQSSPNSPALAGTVSLSAGGAAPLTINVRLATSGYQVAMRGPVGLARAKDLFGAAGIEGTTGWDALAGEAAQVDLTAEGRWLAAEEPQPVETTANQGQSGTAPKPADNLNGTVTLRDVNWKADFLANPVEISQATLHLGGEEIRWEPVAFTYGPVKGTGTLTVPVSCPGPDPCPPRFQLRFGSLDVATLQSTVLGAQQKGTLLSELLDRLRPSSAPPWPPLEGSVNADTLVLGPVTLEQPAVELSVSSSGAEITSFSANLLGGRMHGSGTFSRPASDQDKPAYAFDCRLENLNSRAVGQVIGQSWSGGQLNANGKIEVSGYSDKDLASSAKGTVHFEWRHGAWTPGGETGSDESANVPAVLVRFDSWTADAVIRDGAITLGENQVQQGGHARTVEGRLTFGNPPRVRFPGLANASRSTPKTP